MTQPNRVLFRLAAGLSAALALQAAHAADDPCFQKAQSQAALNQCASAAYQRADADLNRLYRLMTARLSTDDAARKRLVDAQRKWLQFRDAECAFQTIRTVGGSVQPMNVSSCLTDLTRERVTDLHRELKEELDLTVEPDALDPFAFASHAYPDFHLLMPLYVATRFGGVMKLDPNSAQAAKWVQPQELRAHEMPPADVVLVNRLIERNAA